MDRRKHTHRRLACEHLEDRRLMAAQIMHFSSGDLFILGTGGDDRVTVSELNGMVNISANTYSSTDGYSSTARSIDAASVQKIYFYGNDGNDYFDNSTSITSRLYGDRGNDSLIGGSGSDLIDGGAGNDYIWGDYSETVGAGDLLYGSGGNDHLYGRAGNDEMFGGDADDHLYGGLGNDQMAGDSVFSYDYSRKEYEILASGRHGNDVLYGGAGNDLMRGGQGNDTLSGEAGDDQIYGEAPWFVWSSLAGNDVISGGSGNDLLDGDGGNDTLSGGSGGDTVRGDDGDDFLQGGDGSDLVDGGRGDDYLDGAENGVDDHDHDELYGDRGDDHYIVYQTYGRIPGSIFGLGWISQDTITDDPRTFQNETFDYRRENPFQIRPTLRLFP